jgi:hypothetical protein
MSKLFSYAAYVVATLMMAFGWLCALAQGDAPQDNPDISGIVVLFTMALALLAISAITSRRANRWTKYLLLPLIGLQGACCLFVVVAEFKL